ncbi:MAG: hypothetical protein WC043_09310 [Pseudobdellovibrionaceae bacterium]
MLQTDELPRHPYDGDQIRDFLAARTGNQSTRIRVFFERDQTAAQPAFRIGYGDKIKGPDHPSFLAFDRAQILDSQQRPRIINDIKRTAAQLAAQIKAETSPYAQESKKLFEQIADNPYRLYQRLQDEIKNASVRPWDRMLEHDQTTLDKLVTKFQALPPWMQIMIVESDTVYRYGYSHLSGKGGNIKQNGLIGFYNKIAGIAGQFKPIHGDFWAGPQGEGRWVDTVDIARLAGFDTLYHEEGHKLSHYFGLKAKGEEGDETPLASSLPAWKNGVEQTKLQTTFGNAGLKFHFLFYPDDAHDEEAIAEMTRYYTQSYIDHAGDAAKIDKHLGHKLPDLWPVFRDEVIPAYSAMAQEAYQPKSGQRPQAERAGCEVSSELLVYA